MAQMFEKVAVVGLGYVGLPTAAILATRGIDVVGADSNPETVRMINEGRAPIVEPDLDVMVRGAVASKKLRAVEQIEPADAFIIAVPTPFKDGHKPDLSYLRTAADGIAPVLATGNLVVLESTSPAGTTESLSQWLAEARPDLTFPHRDGEASDIRVAHSPERVLPGQILLELVQNDRVIGGVTEKCSETAAALYALFVNGACHLTSARTAELVKLAENAFRDTSIAFANEMSLVCARLGVDPWEMIELANRHPRVNILNPGPGVGGHCIAVDPWFIVDSAPAETPLIQTAREVNDGKPGWVVDQAIAACEGKESPTIACLGLAYKADIDDLRESPAVTVVEQLAARQQGQILVVEPHIASLPPSLAKAGKVKLVSLEHALEQSDIVILLTDHRAFRQTVASELSGKSVIDTRGAWREMDFNGA